MSHWHTAITGLGVDKEKSQIRSDQVAAGAASLYEAKVVEKAFQQCLLATRKTEFH